MAKIGYARVSSTGQRLGEATIYRVLNTFKHVDNS